MKVIKWFLIVGMLFLPYGVKADIETKNLEEVLTEEGITHDLSSYKETDDQIPIYLFRGNGCGYCHNLLTYINSIIPEYGKYFKVVSYEVWENKDNSNLMKQVAKFLDEDAGGVPFYVIGEEAFVGYGSSYDEQIKNAIINLYNSKNRYDVMNEMKKETNETNNSSNSNNLVWIISSIGLSTIVILLVDYKNKKDIVTKIEELNTKLSTSKKKENQKNEKEKKK